MQYQSALNEGQITYTWEAEKIVDFLNATTKRQFDINMRFTDQEGRESIPSRRYHHKVDTIWGKGC